MKFICDKNERGTTQKGRKMIIEKSEKRYEIFERLKHWLVVLKSGALSVEFQIPKDICNTEAELKEYIESEKMF